MAPVWSPPPRRTGADARPAAASVLADLWSEREQQARLATRPEPAAPRPSRKGHGKSGLIAAVLALGLLLGGGVGVFAATQGIGVPSKTKFIAKADAICRRGNGTVTSAAKPTSYPELATALGTVVTATDAQLTELRKIKLPGGGGRSQATAAFNALASTGQAARDLQDAAVRKDDVATAAATRRVAAQFGDAGAQAKAFGFTSCAAGLQSGVDNLVGGSKALVKTAFVAKADNLCREGARNMAAIPEPGDDPRELSRYLGRAVQIGNKLTADMRALTVPPGDETTVAEMLAAQDEVMAKAVEMRDAASSADRSRFAAADKEMSRLTTAGDAKLDAYGLTVCGSNFGNT